MFGEVEIGAVLHAQHPALALQAPQRALAVGREDVLRRHRRSGRLAEAQELYPCLAACSFDKGFHSPANRERLDAALELNALPRKGRLSKADREREGAPAFRAARRAHAAVESAINNLEQRGLGRVRARGADGFERMVGLAVLAGNLHRIGLVLQRAERARLKRERAKRKRAALRLAA